MKEIWVTMLNKRAVNFVKNFSYTLSSNFINMIVSALIVFIVPKLFGVEEYGYWQLYLFYSSYVPLLQFGWTDGVHLRYGGARYNELDKRLFFSQFIILMFVQILLGMIIWICSNIFIFDHNKIFIFKMIAIFLIIINVRYLFLQILQATNKFKIYAQIIIMDRLLFVILITLILVFGVRDYELLILVDIIGKFISLLYSIIKCRDIVFLRLSSFYFSLNEIFLNISAGIKIMIASTASMLIIGVIRLGIERTWDVSTFGKVSLTLSISNFIMVFIYAMGKILFPTLRRIEQEKLPNIYSIIKTFLMVILLGVLILYYPINILLSNWLPQYADSLKYMALVFPMIVFEGKMALLINTYLKTLRREKLLLKINLLSLLFSTLISFITIVLVRNLDLVIMSIVIILAFKCILAEILLSRIINVPVYRDIIFEVTMVSIFICAGWYFSSWLSIILYLLAYSMYILVKRQDIKSTVKNLGVLLKN